MEKEKINEYIINQVEKGGITSSTLVKISSYLKQMIPGLNMDHISDLLKENPKFYQLVNDCYAIDQYQRQQEDLIVDLDETVMLIMDTYSMLKDFSFSDDNIDINAIQDNNFHPYLKEIYQRPLLTREQEKEYLEKIQSGDSEAKKYFLECNLRLVISIARRYLNRGMEFLDIIQNGNLGLMKALENYDPNGRTKFSTYAYYWVHQYIKRSLSENGLIRHPAHVSEKIKLYYQAVESLKEELHYNPTIDEISKKMNWEIDTTLGINDFVNHRSHYYSIEQSHVEDDSPFEEILESDEISVEDSFVKEELKEQLKKYMASILSEREIKVLELRFGLVNGKAYTLEEIGNLFGVTRERIRQLENRALTKLRNSRRLASLHEYQSVPSFNSTKWEVESSSSLSSNATYQSTTNWQIKKEETIKKQEGRTIYQKFSRYSKESIDIVLSLLTKEELSLLKLDLGEDLCGLEKSKLTIDDRRRLNLVVTPKMIRMLEELEKKTLSNDLVGYQKVKS